jgi:very-short-patch-repair endonuclease
VLARRQLIQAGMGAKAVDSRIQSGRLLPINRGVYALGHAALTQRGRWMGAVLACGEGATLSHRSAAALWGLMRPGRRQIDVTSRHGRSGRPGIALHRGRLDDEDRVERDGIPVTSLSRTLLDLAEVIEESRWDRAAEEAERLGLLELVALERVCDRGSGRRGLGRCMRLVEEARAVPRTRSVLEDRFAAVCESHDIVPPSRNVLVGEVEVDALWPRERLIVELDGFSFHGHRAAFERDRARDTALQAAGYKVIRLTHRRLEAEPAAVAADIARLLRSRA